MSTNDLTNIFSVRQVVSTQYLPGGVNSENLCRSILHQRLIGWEKDLPPEMQLTTSSQPETLFLAGMLHMAYK